MQLLDCGFNCNNAHLSGEGGTGDPTELALRISGAKADLVVDGVQRLEEIPFDSSSSTWRCWSPPVVASCCWPRVPRK